MAIHTGHRKRLKNKFLQAGFTHFDDHEILEALLFYTIPYRDTNPLSHALIEEGGSLSRALRLDPEILLGIPGCPKGAPLFFSLFLEAGRRAHGKEPTAPTYGSREALRDLARQITEGVTDDRTYLLLFDNHYHLLEAPEVFRGYYASGAFRARDLVAPALRARASVAVLVSTHGNRIARPDTYELTASRHMAAALRLVGVKLADHLIIAGAQCFSVGSMTGALLCEDAPPLKLGEDEEVPRD